jgi:hypothetical protein
LVFLPLSAPPLYFNIVFPILRTFQIQSLTHQFLLYKKLTISS